MLPVRRGRPEPMPPTLPGPSEGGPGMPPGSPMTVGWVDWVMGPEMVGSTGSAFRGGSGFQAVRAWRGGIGGHSCEAGNNRRWGFVLHG
jgi:hypothetical protein